MAAQPLVGIIMGSDSDLPVMQDAANILEGIWVCQRGSGGWSAPAPMPAPMCCRL